MSIDNIAQQTVSPMTPPVLDRSMGQVPGELRDKGIDSNKDHLWQYKAEHIGDMSLWEQYNYVNEVFGGLDKQILNTNDITAGEYKKIFDGLQENQGTNPLIKDYVAFRQNLNNAIVQKI